jgi:hypothetical protein
MTARHAVQTQRDVARPRGASRLSTSASTSSGSSRARSSSSGSSGCRSICGITSVSFIGVTVYTIPQGSGS